MTIDYREVRQMKNTKENVRILAENRDNIHGFDVWLEYSGRREYLLFHRHNGLLYEALKDGVSLETLRRRRPLASPCGLSRRQDRRRITRLQDMLDHLLLVAEDYIKEREACETEEV